MKNACDYCKWQKDRKIDRWFCTKYGIPMWSERIYCVGHDKKEGNREEVDISVIVRNSLQHGSNNA